MLMALACTLPQVHGKGAECPIVLTDVTGQTGIKFHHNDGSTGAYRIVEYVSAGLALLDYDGDGLLDIYFVNGAPLEQESVDSLPRDALYRNLGACKFADVTDVAGLGDTKHGLGVTAADYDNDGDQDLYVNNYGNNVLYRNNGNGHFDDVTGAAGVENGDRVGAMVSFLDANCDGQLDLFVGNYVKAFLKQSTTMTFRGISVYPAPLTYPRDTNTLYRNMGNGTFKDVSVQSGINAHPGTAMGGVCFDYDNDGDTDIFVCNDMTANFLFENDGTGKFKEVGLLGGLAYDITGKAQGSMGVDCGDYDRDGWLDLMMTNYQDEVPVLFRNSGKGYFDDVSRLTGAGVSALRLVTWGVGFVDFDNDGDLDIFIATGHLEDKVRMQDDSLRYETTNILLMNTGNGKFVDVSSKAGDGLQVKRASRGTVFGDLDNDGDIDVVVLNSRRRPTILRNDSANDNHWIQIRLRGEKVNRDGVGSHVKVVAGDLVQVAEVHSGHSYQSHSGMRLHFGLAKHDRLDHVEVQWLGGKTERFRNISVDRKVTLVEGTGQHQTTTNSEK